MNFIEFEGVRSTRKVLFYVLVAWMVFNHFVRLAAPTSSYHQPTIGGGMSFSRNDTLISLNNFRVSSGKTLESTAGFCPVSLYVGCSLVLQGTTTLVGLSE